MKSLILTSLLVFSFASFGAQTTVENCEAKAESTTREGKDVKSAKSGSDSKKENQSSAQ